MTPQTPPRKLSDVMKEHNKTGFYYRMEEFIKGVESLEAENAKLRAMVPKDIEVGSTIVILDSVEYLELTQKEARAEAAETREKELGKKLTNLSVEEAYQRNQKNRAESRIREAQKLGELFPCWESIDKDGIHDDPDFCHDCEQMEDEYKPPCWLGKLKVALGGGC